MKQGSQPIGVIPLIILLVLLAFLSLYLLERNRELEDQLKDCQYLRRATTPRR